MPSLARNQTRGKEGLNVFNFQLHMTDKESRDFLFFLMDLESIQMIQSLPLRLAMMVSGWISLILGIIGIFLPLLPTTPFVLLAACCFSKSSPRLHSWLINQPRLGPMIQNWEQQGSISQNAKVTSTVLMIGMFGVSFLLFNLSFILKGMLVGIATGVLLFIWTRPLPLRHFNELGDGPTDTGENLVRLG